MANLLHGLSKDGRAEPISINKRGRLRIADSGWIIVLLGIEIIQALALIAILYYFILGG